MLLWDTRAIKAKQKMDCNPVLRLAMQNRADAMRIVQFGRTTFWPYVAYRIENKNLTG